MDTEVTQDFEASLFRAELQRTVRSRASDWVTETEGLAQVRHDRCFFGDLFRPERQRLFGHRYRISRHETALALETASGCGVFLLCESGDSDPSVPELLKAAAAGYDAILLEVGECDRSYLQYLTEVCREVRLSPIWMVQNEEELQVLLQTDAPYVGLYYENSGALGAGEAPRLSTLPCRSPAISKAIPREILTLCLYSPSGPDSESFLHRIASQGFDAYIDVSSLETHG